MAITDQRSDLLDYAFQRPLAELIQEFGTAKIRRVVDGQLVSVWSDDEHHLRLCRAAVLAATSYRVPKAQALAVLDVTPAEAPEALNELYPKLRAHFPALTREQMYRYARDNRLPLTVQNGPTGKPTYRGLKTEIIAAIESMQVPPADDRDAYEASLANLPDELVPEADRDRIKRERRRQHRAPPREKGQP